MSSPAIDPRLEQALAAVPALPDRFNLEPYYLGRNLEEGRGSKVALRCGSRSATFAELAVRVRRLTAWLRAVGLRPEERVLIVLPDGIEFAETWFATLRAGGVFAMVSPLLPTRDFLAYLEYTRARVVVTAAEVLPSVIPAARVSRHLEQVLVVGGTDWGVDRVQGGGRVGIVDYEEALSGQDPDGPLAHVEPTGPDDLAGWLFTSGSTGRPKACVHTHGDFAYSTETYALQVAGYREQDLCLSVPKLFFGYATGTNLMFPFRVGAGVVLFPERSTADRILDLIEEYRPTFLTGVPTLLNNLLRSPRIEGIDLSCLRVCLSAGEALPPRLLEEWYERTGVEVLDGIGSAEMFHIYISNYPGDVRPGSLGRLVPGYVAEIVGPDGERVPDGEPGRLRIAGGSTAMCYWADKAASIETFQGAWCTTADVFRRDAEGYFTYVGRGDDLLKVSGIWVSPLEIEDVLLGHEAVKECCVVGHDGGDGLVKPLAFVVPREGIEGSEDLAIELKDHVKERLAPHKYPRWFCWRDALPRNDRGKVARKELRDELERGVEG